MKSKFLVIMCAILLGNSMLVSLMPNVESIPPEEQPNGGLMNAPWPMFGRNIRHWGLSPHGTSTNPGDLRWSYLTGDIIQSSPAISSDGTVYIGSRDHDLHAINPDGTEKWRFTTGYRISSSPAIAADGTIYIPSHDGRLYAINPDGSLKWKTHQNPIWIRKTSPVIGHDGIIYTGYGYYLKAFYPDGTEKWSFDAIGQVFSSPAIGSDGTIYVGASKLHAIYPDGTEKWNFPTPMSIESSPAVGTDGTIYIGCGDGKLYAINPDGTEKWNFVTGDVVSSSPSIGADGTIYVGSKDHNVYAINPDSSQKWIYPTGGSVRSSPAIGADGMIYVGSMDGKLYAINPDGTQRWSFMTGSADSSPAIGSDGTVYIGSFDHNLYAIGTSPIPIADAGPDQTVNEGDVVQFDGSNSIDPDIVPDFGANKAVNQNSGPSESPAVAIDGFNNPHVVWVRKLDPFHWDIWYTSSPDQGENFDEDIQVNEDILIPDPGCEDPPPECPKVVKGVKARDPAIAVDNNNNVHVVWADMRDDIYRIYHSILLFGNSEFEDSTRIDDTTFKSISPNIVIDNNNYLHVVWVDAQEGVNPFEMRYSKSTDGGSSFAPSIKVNDMSLSNVGKRYLAIDPFGFIHVSWGFFDYVSWTSSNHYSNSKDGGLSFNPSIIIREDIDVEYSGPIYSSIYADINGNVHAIWQDSADFHYYDHYYAKILKDDNAFKEYKKVNAGGRTVGFSTVAVDGSNGYIHTTWTDTRYDGDHDIFHAQSVDNGLTFMRNVRVNDDPYAECPIGIISQYEPYLAIDSLGNVHIAWYDNRLCSPSPAGMIYYGKGKYIMSYEWDFDISRDTNGDTVPDNDVDATGPTPTFSWNDDYVSTVKLTVIDNDGFSDSDTITVTINNVNPLGDFNIVSTPTGIFYEIWGFDLGSDDLTFHFYLDGAGPVYSIIHYNNGVSPDPYPSPYSGTAPFNVYESGDIPFVISIGSHLVGLLVLDDDGGSYYVEKTVII
jgi:outer membrane protein assembly factor BamB